MVLQLLAGVPPPQEGLLHHVGCVAVVQRQQPAKAHEAPLVVVDEVVETLHTLSLRPSPGKR